MSAREEELIARALLADQAKIDVYLKEKRWAEVAALVRFARRDVPVELAQTDPALYRLLREQITRFFLRGGDVLSMFNLAVHARVPIEELRSINDWAIRSTWPDLVILLDVSTKVIANRMKSRHLDRFERAGADFHARVAGGFAEMAAADPDYWAMVDASRSVADVATAIRSIVADRLGI